MVEKYNQPWRICGSARFDGKIIKNGQYGIERPGFGHGDPGFGKL